MPPARSTDRRIVVVFLLVIAAAVAATDGQPVSARVNGDMVHLRAAGFEFIKDAPLTRLKDGRSVPVDYEVVVLQRPGGASIAEVRARFVLSYDLWEERFAVTRTGTPTRSVSHLAARDAEAWCLDQLAIPASAFARAGRDAPFWVRLTYRIPDEDRSEEDPNAGTFTLRGLIDKLSRRRSAGEPKETIEAGPIRIQ